MVNIERLVARLSPRTMPFYRGGEFNPNVVNLNELVVTLVELSPSRLDTLLFYGFTRLDEKAEGLSNELGLYVKAWLLVDAGETIDWSYLTKTYGGLNGAASFIGESLAKWVMRKQWKKASVHSYMYGVSRDVFVDQYKGAISLMTNDLMVRFYELAARVTEALDG